MEKRVTSAFGWKFFERISVQGTNFLVTLLLARLLTPSDYGTVSVVTIFIALATTFVQGGFNTALIQKKDVDGNDYLTILMFSEIVAAALYAVIFFAAPFISNIYHTSELSSLLRVMAIVLFPGAFNAVQVAYVTRDLRFKVLTISSFVSALLAAAVGIGLAVAGFGAWALVIQQLVNQTATCFVTYCIVRWIPKGRFSVQSLRRLLPFGAKVFASNFIIALFLDIRSLLIGQIYSSEALGFFNRGKQFPQAVMESVNGTIQTVLLPVYSKKQDSVSSVAKMVSKTVRISSLLLFPMMVGLAAVAEPLVSLLLTDKWLECVPYLQIFAIGYLFQAIQLAIIQAIKAIGDSGTPLKLEIIKKCVEVFFLIVTIRQGVLIFASSLLICSVISHLLNMFAAKRILNYTVKQQLIDILPATLFSAVMAACVKCVTQLLNGAFVSLVAGIASFNGKTVTVIGNRKGKNIEENIRYNFGMASPEGYRKAVRVMKQAEKFRRPVITFVDTPGAYPGMEAESNGQSNAIAGSIAAMLKLTVPVISVITGEGGSGGALALAAADRVYMLENAVYSILSPEGFASIIYKDAKKAPQASEIMKLTAQELFTAGLVDGVIAEGDRCFSDIARMLEKELGILCRMKSKELVNSRYDKFRNIDRGEIK